MKIFKPLLFLFFPINVLAQSSEQLIDHYPIEIGNIWDYQGGTIQLGTFYPGWKFKKVIGDSIHTDGYTYRIHKVETYSVNPGGLGSYQKYTILQRVDSTNLNVYQDLGFYSSPELQDSLNANIGDQFRISPGNGDSILRLMEFMTINLFDKERSIRKLEIINPIIGFSFQTLEGIGEYSWSSGGEGCPSFWELNGTIIRGDTSGTLLRLKKPNLKLSHAQITLTTQNLSQIIYFSNHGLGLSIIDSVTVNDQSKFKSQPGYKDGYLNRQSFTKGPFFIFPKDSVRLQFFVKESSIQANFIDTFLVFARDVNGEKLPTIKIPITFEKTVSVSEQNNLTSLYFEFHQNYPNPFNPTTTILFNIPSRRYVTLTIYNLEGKQIETLHMGQLNAGDHTFVWEPPPNFPSGIYFARLQADQFIRTRKLILQK